MASLLTKIAHNPRVSLGPLAHKPVQEVISSERRLIEATQRVAVERDRSSAALREWGNSEGDDLRDVLDKVTKLFEYLSKAEVAYCEHNGNSRLKFKDIRTREENLATLKKSRDSLQGRIEAHERKVSKMKEENKDLPAAKQKLRDWQQEMIGLENSVLTEDTRLGDFKRMATREALSLKLGALLELAEKTVIVAELGKLIVDMLPTDVTEPGQPRTYYEGYARTDELLSEAQRCLQDVVFNPAPISEPYAQQDYTGGGENGQPQGQYGAEQQHPQYTGQTGYHPQQHHEQGQQSEYQSQQHQYGGSEYGQLDQHQQQQQHQQYPTSSSTQHYAAETPYTSYSQQQQQQTPQSLSYSSPSQPQQQQQPQSPYDSSSYRRNSKRLSQTLPEQPLPHNGPQLQPLPDFGRPLSVVTPSGTSAGGDARQLGAQQSNGLAGAAGLNPMSPSAVGSTPQVDGYSSRPPHGASSSSSAAAGAGGLAALVSYEQNRTSLAYLGEAPPSEPGHGHEHEQQETVEEREAREAQEAFEQEARDRESVGSQVGQGQGQGGYQPRRTEEYPAYEYDAPPPSSAGPSSAGYAQRDFEQGDGASESLAVPPHHSAAAHNGLSPIVEVPTPAMTHVEESPRPSIEQQHQPQQPYTYQPLLESQQQQKQQQSPPPASPASPAPSTAPPPSFHTTARPNTIAPLPPAILPTSAPSSSFEPRPLTPSGQRRPIQIRAGSSTTNIGPDNALGSKYGDIHVPVRGIGAADPANNGVSSPTMEGGGKRTIAAGAFRRAPPSSQSSSGGTAVPGRSGFAPSGYSGPPPPALDRNAPSESELIAQQWRSSAIPLSPHPQALDTAGEGELPTGQVQQPAFDTRPLMVNKSPVVGSGGGGGGGGGGGVGRSGTLPAHLTTSHGRSSSSSSAVNPSSDLTSAAPPVPPYSAAPLSPVGLPYDQPSFPQQQGGVQPPMSPASQEGFGSNRFVTKLD
ncbi:hypothetical protein JCM8547_007812 [Rhodosporidiobolus lusitaniae]